jgi:hypothetical protein
MTQATSRHKLDEPEAVPASVAVEHPTRRFTPFWRHFVEMFAVMVVGMVTFAAIFVTIVGLTFDQATLQYPTVSLLVIAAGMSVPMAAWMLHRGMGWRNSAEMATAMVVPVIPFLSLVWLDVTASAACGPYCLLAIAAMLGLMLYRRSEYSMEMVHR